MPFIEYTNDYAAFQFSAFQSPYPVCDMPALIRDAVLEVSANLCFPIELCAQAALGSVSLASQDFINVHCLPYDPAPVSLYLETILKSSGGKSVVFARFLKAVKAFERKLRDEFNDAMTDYLAEIKIWEDDARRLSKEYCEASPGSDSATQIREQRLQHQKDRPVKPHERELRYETMSPAGLRDALVANHAIGILSPDGGPILTGMTFSQPAMLSGYWSGEDRPVGLAKGTLRPVEPRLTMAFMTQEGQFGTYIKNRGEEAFDTGLRGRILVVHVKIVDYPGQSAHYEVCPEPKLDMFNQRIADILNQAIPASRERHTMKLSDDATQYLKLFKESVHNVLICGDYAEEMKSFFRKIGQQATRLAALFHYFDGATGDISRAAMKGAISLCEWYLFEFIRVFTPYVPSPQQKGADAAQKLLQWLQEATIQPWKHPKLTVGQYTERDLRNYAIRNDAKKLDVAINTLQCQGHIYVNKGTKGGRIICYPSWSSPMSNATGSYDSILAVIDAPVMPTHQNNVNQYKPTHNAGVKTSYSRQRMQVPPYQADGNADHQHNADDAEQMCAVRAHLEKSAIEDEIGSIQVSAGYGPR
jgi:hypothetical protein